MDYETLKSLRLQYFYDRFPKEIRRNAIEHFVPVVIKFLAGCHPDTGPIRHVVGLCDSSRNYSIDDAWKVFDALPSVLRTKKIENDSFVMVSSGDDFVSFARYASNIIVTVSFEKGEREVFINGSVEKYQHLKESISFMERLVKGIDTEFKKGGCMILCGAYIQQEIIDYLISTEGVFQKLLNTVVRTEGERVKYVSVHPLSRLVIIGFDTPKEYTLFFEGRGCVTVCRYQTSIEERIKKDEEVSKKPPAPAVVPQPSSSSDREVVSISASSGVTISSFSGTGTVLVGGVDIGSVNGLFSIIGDRRDHPLFVDRVISFLNSLNVSGESTTYATLDLVEGISVEETLTEKMKEVVNTISNKDGIVFSNFGNKKWKYVHASPTKRVYTILTVGLASGSTPTTRSIFLKAASTKYGMLGECIQSLRIIKNSIYGNEGYYECGTAIAIESLPELSSTIEIAIINALWGAITVEDKVLLESYAVVNSHHILATISDNNNDRFRVKICPTTMRWTTSAKGYDPSTNTIIYVEKIPKVTESSIPTRKIVHPLECLLDLTPKDTAVECMVPWLTFPKELEVNINHSSALQMYIEDFHSTHLKKYSFLLTKDTFVSFENDVLVSLSFCEPANGSMLMKGTVFHSPLAREISRAFRVALSHIQHDLKSDTPIGGRLVVSTEGKVTKEGLKNVFVFDTIQIQNASKLWKVTNPDTKYYISWMDYDYDGEYVYFILSSTEEKDHWYTLSIEESNTDMVVTTRPRPRLPTSPSPQPATADKGLVISLLEVLSSKKSNEEIVSDVKDIIQSTTIRNHSVHPYGMNATTPIDFENKMMWGMLVLIIAEKTTKIVDKLRMFVLMTMNSGCMN